MAAPEVPIDVDPATGIWSSDGLAMVYVPRHFFVNNHQAIAEALGRDRYSEILFAAGHKSAYQWCAAQPVTGLAVFRHYLTRLSQRGWGRFSIQNVDPDAGTARIRLDHSIFCLADHGGDVPPLCYMFAGWFPGALEWVCDQAGARQSLCCEETQCAAMAGHDHCLFTVQPAS